MTLVAGIVSRVAGKPIDRHQADQMARALSRNPRTQAQLVEMEGACFAVVDLGILRGSGIHRGEDGSVSLLCGDPVLGNGGRAADLAAIHDEWRAGGTGLLGRVRGVFSLAQYDPTTGQLRLVADKLGTRPLYYWSDDHTIVFASALRVIEALNLPVSLDLPSVVETATLGFALADRTPYAEVKCLGAAEIVTFTGATQRNDNYWQWDRLPQDDVAEEQLAARIDAAFRSAVELRLAGDRHATSFLTGGMDSRVVVAVLRALGADVDTFNFSYAQTQDGALSDRFAREIGCHHHSPGVPYMFHEARVLMSMSTALSEAQLSGQPERPRAVWSGDGGSVGLGHVYISDRIAAYLRAGEIEHAVNQYLTERGAHVPRHLFPRDIAEEVCRLPLRGIIDELSKIDVNDPVRAFHLFLMLNDQRRHLSSHFEHIDVHGIEMLLPFYDSDLLACILASPIELCLHHRVYHTWFMTFPPPVSTVPWQTYPGHVPCPVPIPEGLRYQWSANAFPEMRGQRARKLLRDAVAILRTNRFPKTLMRRGSVAVAGAFTGLQIRDYGYVIRMASAVLHHYQMADGRVAVVTPTGHGGAIASRVVA